MFEPIKMPYKNTFDKIARMLNNYNRNIKIIDLGCGIAKLGTKLKEYGFKNVVNCDMNFKPDKNTIRMDLNKKFNFKSSSFDVVVSTDVIEHIENKFLFFREVKRILKRKGIFIFSTPNIHNLPNRLCFLLRNKFIEFPHNKVHKGVISKHTNPVFIWDLPDFFKYDITYNRGFIPVFRIPFFCNNLFGQEYIIKCSK